VDTVPSRENADQFMTGFVLIDLQLKSYGNRFQGLMPSKGSMGHDMKHAKEVYNKDRAMFKE
jgi:hypothetical protein